MSEHHPENEHRPVRLGFARGTAPGKWARRWLQAVGEPLDLVPVPVTFGREHAALDSGGIDVMLERTRPGESPAGATAPGATRHAVRLYTEAVALVVAKDHELATAESIHIDELPLVTLLDHPDHLPQWPDAEPWADPEWKPRDVDAALALVASGAGAMLLPLPLARQASSRREHAVLLVRGAAELEGGAVWATWDVSRDAADVQQLAGIMRGRTARSSRPAAPAASAAPAEAGRGEAASRTPSTPRRPPPKAGPKPGSRGAQLAAAKRRPRRGKR